MYTSKRSNQLTSSVAVLCIGVVAFFAGFYTNKHYEDDAVAKQIATSAEAADLESNVDLDLFWKVWGEIKDSYVDQPVSDEELFYGALEGLAKSVDDPYTEYLTPEDSQTFEENIQGVFEGIGAEIGIKRDQLIIVTPLVGSPAEASGLQAGDAIVKIDGEDTTGISLSEAVTKIRGDKGTAVVLTVYREGEQDFRDISVTRDTIDVPNITTENMDGILYVSMNKFNEDSGSEFKDIAQQALLDGNTGLILDLRNNPGGLLSESIEIASQFITEGVIVNEVFSDGSEDSYNSKGYGTLADMPTVVLINGGSASASEIVAGALQDYDKATILGEQSYGKGSVQEYRSYTDGSSLKITVAKWLTPNEVSIQENGITPDVVIERTFEDYENNTDPQLDAALELLRQ